ncbi:MAG: ribosomal protein L11 methyltransferase [Betaproteobacteria bacterium RIFCSPLOWO2_12_FULL_62_13]|nr:MAG: ribosomal protein L11 methyltransferase [Betaproteobacteria bacterium RIFCSPLOWO2_12_FULL_62_13]
MSWLAVIFEVDAECAEPLADALLEAGAMSADVADANAGTLRERPLFGEPGARSHPGWHLNRLSALFAPEIDLSAQIPAALRAAGLSETTRYRLEAVDDRDWLRATQDQFRPVRISPRLWIVPSWHAAPDPQALNIALDPGSAFGTGTHPTTRLCLRWLETHVRGGETVIDFGCGSGILAIAALKLGAGAACGVDIDEEALLAARSNAMQNRVRARFVAAADEIREPAQLVVANILANPLAVLAPLLAKLTAPGGRVALSGIFAEQADEVRAAYLEWFEIDAIERDEGWALLSGVKR